MLCRQRLQNLLHQQDLSKEHDENGNGEVLVEEVNC